MTKRALPISLWVVAILQFVAPLIFPADYYGGIGLPLWIAVAVVFAILGINLIRLKEWARVATIFVQGFSIIVRLLTMLSNTIPASDASADMMFVATSLISMLLSAVILYRVDLPDVQLLMQQ